MVDPARFTPVADESGLNVPIGEWMLRAACAQNRTWQERGLSLLVSVAISARQFQHKNLVETVAAVLRESGLDARFLELEIAEGTAKNHTFALLRALSATNRAHAVARGLELGLVETVAACE